MLVALPKLCQPILPTEQCSVQTKKLKTGFEWTEVFQKHSITLSFLKMKIFQSKVFETANSCRHLRHLRPIYEFCFEYQAVFGHFPTNPDHFRRFLKTTKDFRRLPEMVVAYQVWDIHKLEKEGNRSENPWYYWNKRIWRCTKRRSAWKGKRVRSF